MNPQPEAILAGALSVAALAALTWGDATARLGFAIVVTALCVGLWVWSAWPLVRGVVR